MYHGSIARDSLGKPPVVPEAYTSVCERVLWNMVADALGGPFI